jgi:hypothetical protein
MVAGADSIDDGSLFAAIGDMDAQNGVTATANASTLNDASINRHQNIANAPISNLFKPPGTLITESEAQLGGNIVYFRPSYVLSLSPFTGAGLLAHEALHNLGLTDNDVEAALGLTSSDCGGGTDCISQRLQEDCFNPRR